MTNILYLSQDKVYAKVVELALANYDVELKFHSDMENIDKELDSTDIVILDNDVTDSIDTIIHKISSKNKPVIVFKNLINGEDEVDISQENVSVLEKPFEDSVLIKEIEKYCDLKIKNEVEEMADEEKKEQLENNEDVLELTDIVEETAEEISDILSTEEVKEDTKPDKVLDDFFSEEEIKENSSSDELLKDEDIQSLLDEPEVSKTVTSSEEAAKEDDFAILDEGIESLDTDTKNSPEMTDTKEESIEEKVDMETSQEEVDVATEEPVTEPATTETGKEPVLEEIKEEPVDVEENISDSSDEEIDDILSDKDTVQATDESEIKIPIDEETKKLAEEVDNEDFEPISEITEEPKSVTEDMCKSKTKQDDTTVDMGVVETKLLEASQKIVEAIEEATVEIAKGIAKVTPKIIEEVSKEIIPKIAQKIISEELNKKN